MIMLFSERHIFVVEEDDWPASECSYTTARVVGSERWTSQQTRMQLIQQVFAVNHTPGSRDLASSLMRNWKMKYACHKALYSLPSNHFSLLAPAINVNRSRFHEAVALLIDALLNIRCLFKTV